MTTVRSLVEPLVQAANEDDKTKSSHRLLCNLLQHVHDWIVVRIFYLFVQLSINCKQDMYVHHEQGRS